MKFIHYLINNGIVQTVCNTSLQFQSMLFIYDYKFNDPFSMQYSRNFYLSEESLYITPDYRSILLGLAGLPFTVRL